MEQVWRPLIGSFLHRGDDNSDVTLVSRDGMQFRAHWAALADGCEYFDNMWKSGMKESTDDKVEVDVAGVTLELTLKILYEEWIRHSFTFTDILPCLSLVHYWQHRNIRVTPYWDNKVFEGSKLEDVLVLYGWCITECNQSGAESCADYLSHVGPDRLQCTPILYDKILKDKVDSKSHWAIIIYVASRYWPALLYTALQSCGICSFGSCLKVEQSLPSTTSVAIKTTPSNRYDADRELFSKLPYFKNMLKDPQTTELNLNVDETTVELLLKVIQGVKKSKYPQHISVEELKKLLPVMWDMSLKTEAVVDHACCKYDKKCLIDLLLWSGRYPEQSVCIIIVKHLWTYMQLALDDLQHIVQCDIAIRFAVQVMRRFYREKIRR